MQEIQKSGDRAMNADGESAADLLEQAIEYLCTTCWHYMRCISLLRRVWDAPGNPALAIDGFWRLFVNSEHIVSHPLEDTIRLLHHEINHMVRDHTYRCRDRNSIAWSYAADLEINSDLASGLGIGGDFISERDLLPNGAPMPSDYGLPDGETAEFYYEKLKGQHEAKAAAGQQVEVGDEPFDPFDSPPVGGYENRNRGLDDRVHFLGCGRLAIGGVGANIARAREEAAAEQGVGLESDINIPGGLRDTATEILRRAGEQSVERVPPADEGGVQSDIGDGAMGDDAKAFPGMWASVPKYGVSAGLVRAAKEILTPRVGWRKVLRYQLDTAHQRAEDSKRRTRQRFDRRSGPVQAGKPKVLKSQVTQGTPDVVLVVDVPSAASNDEVRATLSEAIELVASALADRLANVYVLASEDGEAAAVARSFSEVRGNALGVVNDTGEGEGIIDATARIDADMVVVLTDGSTDWPEHRPHRDAPPVVGIIHDHRSDNSEVDRLERTVPSWADSVMIPTLL